MSPSERSAPPPAPAGDREPAIAHLRHELRTALTAVIGYSEFLLESFDGEGPVEMARALGDLKASGDETLAIVERHLDLGKVSALSEGALAPILRDLSAACGPPVSAMLGLFPGLIEIAEREGRYAIIPLLCKIQAAGAMLEALLKEYSQEGASESLLAAAEAGLPPLSTKGPSAEPVRDEIRGRVLVVDDNSINRDLLRQWIERRGHEVDEASGGHLALELLRKNNYDVILLDLRMPDLDGVQVLEALREEGRLGKAPVIMLSASDEIEGVVQCIKLGADDYLLKPYNPVLLRTRLRLSLELKRLREREQEYLAVIERDKARSGAP